MYKGNGQSPGLKAIVKVFVDMVQSNYNRNRVSEQMEFIENVLNMGIPEKNEAKLFSDIMTGIKENDSKLKTNGAMTNIDDAFGASVPIFGGGIESNVALADYGYIHQRAKKQMSQY